MTARNAAIPPVRYGYGLLMFLLALTGFAQMPIFKRYYIADLPGLGWLAMFYVTHYLHYIGAVLILGLAAYFVTAYLRTRPEPPKLTPSGYLRAGLIGVILVTGLLLAVRNFPGYVFSPGVVIALDLAHLGSVFVFILTALYCWAFSKKWLISPSKGELKGVN
jgi:hypothetical protein